MPVSPHHICESLVVISIHKGLLYLKIHNHELWMFISDKVPVPFSEMEPTHGTEISQRNWECPGIEEIPYYRTWSSWEPTVDPIPNHLNLLTLFKIHLFLGPPLCFLSWGFPYRMFNTFFVPPCIQHLWAITQVIVSGLYTMKIPIMLHSPVPS